jgi:hypothetical protein
MAKEHSHKTPWPNGEATVSVRSFLGGVLIGLTFDLPFVAGTDITNSWLEGGLSLWGALALWLAALHFVRRKGGLGRGRQPP